MGRAGRRWTCPVRRPADRSRSSLRLHGAAEVVLVGGGTLGGAVVGVPAGDLPATGFFGVAALFGGGAGFEFGEGSLGAADGVGGLVCGGHAGPVVFGSRFALGLAGGLVADVGRVGFGGVGRGDGFGFALVGVAGGGEVGEVVVVGDLDGVGLRRLGRRGGLRATLRRWCRAGRSRGRCRGR